MFFGQFQNQLFARFYCSLTWISAATVFFRSSSTYHIFSQTGVKLTTFFICHQRYRHILQFHWYQIAYKNIQYFIWKFWTISNATLTLLDLRQCLRGTTKIKLFVRSTPGFKRSQSICILCYDLSLLWPAKSTIKSHATPLGFRLLTDNNWNF